jgi:hypothetical protein
MASVAVVRRRRRREERVFIWIFLLEGEFYDLPARIEARIAQGLSLKSEQFPIFRRRPGISKPILP